MAALHPQSKPYHMEPYHVVVVRADSAVKAVAWSAAHVAWWRWEAAGLDWGGVAWWRWEAAGLDWGGVVEAPGCVEAAGAIEMTAPWPPHSDRVDAMKAYKTEQASWRPDLVMAAHLPIGASTGASRRALASER